MANNYSPELSKHPDQFISVGGSRHEVIPDPPKYDRIISLDKQIGDFIVSPRSRNDDDEVEKQSFDQKITTVTQSASPKPKKLPPISKSALNEMPKTIIDKRLKSLQILASSTADGLEITQSFNTQGLGIHANNKSSGILILFFLV